MILISNLSPPGDLTFPQDSTSTQELDLSTGLNLYPEPGNFMNKGRGGQALIPLSSWRRGQQPPAIRSRIGQLVV